jgi:hypothetical protein
MGKRENVRGKGKGERKGERGRGAGELEQVSLDRTGRTQYLEHNGKEAKTEPERNVQKI